MEKCDGCEENTLVFTTYCVTCDQWYCAACSTAHTRQNATKTDILLCLTPEESDLPSTKIGINCKICDSKKEVISLCVTCRELYCDECSNRHHHMKATKDHHLTVIRLRDGSQIFNPIKSMVRDHKYAQVEVPQPPGILERNIYKGNLLIEKSCAAPGETEITRIRGMTMLGDGRLIIIDSKNKCIKIFKPDWYDFTSKKQLTDEPRGISFISQDEIVITFAEKREVRIFNIDKVNNLWMQRSFGIKDKPYSISYSKKTFAIELGEGDDGIIAITDFNGNITHLVKGQNTNFGQFTGNTIRLVHDNDKRVVFVVNVSDGYIHCVDYNTGIVKWDIKINTPRGIALYENMLFVVSKIDSKVYQINPDNGKVCTLLSDTDKVGQPRYIAVQPLKGKLALEVGSNVNMYTVIKPNK